MRALIVVDMQRDFMPGGPLGVDGADALVRPINVLTHDASYGLVVATQDWHPRTHMSFASQYEDQEEGDLVELEGLPQVLWPEHCVQCSEGAEFADGLDLARVQAIFRKGMDPMIDSYSGFFDNGRRRSTGLGDFLRGRGVTDVDVCGVATDYCVRFTALDAAGLGFRVRLIRDACAGVELQPGDVERALQDLREGGVQLV